jgi:hypothetical protein
MEHDKEGSMKLIPLSKDMEAQVDDADYDELMRYPWHANPSGQKWYARRIEYGNSIYMHIQLMEPTGELEVDHIDGNSLNNQRCNLRLVTRSQQMINREHYNDYRGVYRNRDRWRARGKLDGAIFDLGTFDTPEQAARAYDTWARQYHGEFARPNFTD